MERYLKETPMLDFSAPSIRALISERGWDAPDRRYTCAAPEPEQQGTEQGDRICRQGGSVAPDASCQAECGQAERCPADCGLDDSSFEKIRSIYDFVRDEILFGYNTDDSIPASKVLRDGYGQCNTKGTLFMALLRACGIPCRIHGFTIDKKLQKGAMTGLVYRSAPQEVFHSWVEVLLEDTWYELEAFILDKAYLQKLQQANSSCTGAFCGYGVAVRDFRNPAIDFNRNSTYIQSEGITQDFGIYDCPDDLLKEHHQEMSAAKAFLYRHLGRHLMNRNVKKIRNSLYSS